MTFCVSCEKLEDPFSRNIHLGPGEEERPEVERRARSPPLIAVKSVVYRSADRDRDLVALLVSRGMHLRWLTSLAQKERRTGDFRSNCDYD